MPSKKTTAKKTSVKKAVPAKAVESTPEPGTLSGACPRCGSGKFAPEQRTRVDGNRTVRFTILVCERGHTFVRPRPG